MKPVLLLAVATAGLALALWGVVDWSPPLAVQTENGTLLCGDTHVHTYLSFHAGTPLVHLVNARRRGLDFIVFSEHNRAGGGPWGESVARMFNIPIISVDGEEVTNPKYHINGLGIYRSILYTLPADEVVAEIHRQGGLASANHPTEKYWDALAPLFAERKFDAVEYINMGPWNTPGEQPQVEAFMQNMSRAGHLDGVALLGVSDVHLGRSVGEGRTCVEAKNATWEGIKAELSAGRSVAATEGRFYGPLADRFNANPQAVAKITQEPALWTKAVSHAFFALFVLAMLGKWGPWARGSTLAAGVKESEK